MFRWLRIALLGVRGADWTELSGRVDQILMNQTDLTDRFNRLQNRYGMRFARDVAEAREAALRAASAPVARPKSVFEELDG